MLLGYLPSLSRQERTSLAERIDGCHLGPQQKKSKQKTKANQLLKTKVLLQAGTKNTGLNKRQVAVPSSSQLPPHLPVPLQQGPGPQGWGKVVSPRGDPLWLPLLSCLYDLLVSGARQGEMWGLPMSLSKDFSPLEGPRRGAEAQFPSYFDKKLELPAEGHPLSFLPRFRPIFTCLLAYPAPSFLFSG